MKLKYLFSVLSIVALFTFPSCHNQTIPLRRGLSITVTGNVFDYKRNVPLVNFKVYIQEHIEDPYYRSINIDSTFTDDNGQYQLNFKTDGKGFEYIVVAVPSAVPLSHYYGFSVNPLYPKRDTSYFVSMPMTKLTVVKTQITVSDYLGIVEVIDNVGFESEFFNIHAENYGTDTTLYFHLMPDDENVLLFQIAVLDSTSTVATSKYFGKRDTVNLKNIFDDTVIAQLNLYPKKFTPTY